MSHPSLRPCTILLGCLLTISLGAQMSGTYTIDPKGSGSRNFTDFQNAAYQLYVRGINGPVVFEVASGTYSSNPIYLPAVATASSSARTITFRSKVRHGAKLTTYFLIPDYGSRFPVRWYVFDGLEFVVPSSANPPPGLSARGDTTDIEIKNCRFVRCHINVYGSNPSSSTDRIQRWKVHHNVFTGGVSTAYSQCSFLGAHGIDIHHNEFSAGWQTRAHLIRQRPLPGQAISGRRRQEKSLPGPRYDARP